jgi:phosphomannomutase
MKYRFKDPVKIYDARWEADEFSDGEVLRLFEATYRYARLIGADTIVFARDARLGCAKVMEIGIKEAVRSGFRVFACFDPVSTPLSYFAAMQVSLSFPMTMGLTITASHNPKQYIGIKFTVPGVEAIGYDCGPLGGLTKIKELYHRKKSLKHGKKGGTLEILEHPAAEYIRYTMEQAGVKKDDLAGLKFVLDSFNGSAGPEIYKGLTIAGAKIIPLRLVPDGQFPTGSPNPVSLGKMDHAVEVAGQEHADLVIGVDGDGDRIVFGDRKGIFSAGFVMIPILKTILGLNEEQVRQKILYDPKVNPVALSKWSELNADPVLFRNGHSQIKSYMKEAGILAGAEESGHFYHTFSLGNLKVTGENSLLTILLFLQSVRKDMNLISQIRDLQDQIYTTGEFNFQYIDDQQRNDALKAVVQYFENDTAQIRSKSENGIDLEGTVVYRGVLISDGHVLLGDNWYAGYFRVATTEKGVVRSYLSAANAEFGEKIREHLVKILKDDFKGVEIE